jgi:hypothetical protein
MNNALQIAANVATIISLPVAIYALIRANKAVKIYDQVRNSGVLFHHIAGAAGGAGGIGGGGGGGTAFGTGGAGGAGYVITPPSDGPSA